jgi:thiosulfate reductase cytochrome b subunit
MARGVPSIHPLWLRLVHWTNAAAVVVLIMSGWRIYNATGFMGFKFPKDITLGGWLGGAIQWHFAAMWLLFANVIIYAVMSLVTKRWSRQYFPLTPKGLWDDVVHFVRGKLSHTDLSHYNAIQKLAYLFAIVDLVVLVVSGLALWKPVQLSWLAVLVGGYEGARRVHFFAMSGICAFIAVHAVMALLVPKTVKAMIWGR